MGTLQSRACSQEVMQEACACWAEAPTHPLLLRRFPRSWLSNKDADVFTWIWRHCACREVARAGIPSAARKAAGGICASWTMVSWRSCFHFLPVDLRRGLCRKLPCTDGGRHLMRAVLSCRVRLTVRPPHFMNFLSHPDSGCH